MLPPLQVVITGSARGLGFHMARKFVELGDDVVSWQTTCCPPCCPQSVSQAGCCASGRRMDLFIARLTTAAPTCRSSPRARSPTWMQQCAG